MTTTKTIRTATVEALRTAYDGSWYFIAGAGGELTEWVDGYGKMLTEQDIGKPTGWWQTDGATIAEFAREHHGGWVHPDDLFPDDLTCLLYPLDGLNIGRLAMFKIRMGDRWFDDVVDNMRGTLDRG